MIQQFGGHIVGGAGRPMDYATVDPDDIAQAIVEELGKPVNFQDVEIDGATRAAAMLVGLI